MKWKNENLSLASPIPSPYIVHSEVTDETWQKQAKEKNLLIGVTCPSTGTFRSLVSVGTWLDQVKKLKFLHWTPTSSLHYTPPLYGPRNYWKQERISLSSPLPSTNIFSCLVTVVSRPKQEKNTKLLLWPRLPFPLPLSAARSVLGLDWKKVTKWKSFVVPPLASSPTPLFGHGCN